MNNGQLLHMNLEERTNAVLRLQDVLNDSNQEELKSAIDEAIARNSWFTKDSIQYAIDGIKESFLDENKLRNWIEPYQNNILDQRKKVGLILAGNIPMVGFHDVLCVFLSGNISLLKYSEKDEVLLSFLLDKLRSIDKRSESYFQRVDRLVEFDAVIATGSNNSSRYFESYFAKYPHIIRRNRNAIAVIHGNETPVDFNALGIDIFTYFGLGCRNVSKIFVPEGYNFIPLLEVLHEYNGVIYHNKYKNNFDYNIAFFMLNKAKYLNNGAFMIVEDKSIASRIATVNYEYYQNIAELTSQLENHKNEIQCIISKEPIEGYKTFLPGHAQKPELDDFADGVDTMEFLINL